MPAAPRTEFPPIHLARGHRVVLDSDLARLYGVTTTAFNQAIRRNLRRFPADFVFAIGHEEHARLISQIVTSNAGPRGQRPLPVNLKGRGGRRKPSLVFTEHGAIMAATILRSPRAITMSVYVVRAFVRMREALLTNAVILRRLAQVDKKLLEHSARFENARVQSLDRMNRMDRMQIRQKRGQVVRPPIFRLQGRGGRLGLDHE